MKKNPEGFVGITLVLAAMLIDPVDTISIIVLSVVLIFSVLQFVLK